MGWTSRYRFCGALIDADRLQWRRRRDDSRGPIVFDAVECDADPRRIGTEDLFLLLLLLLLLLFLLPRFCHPVKSIGCVQFVRLTQLIARQRRLFPFHRIHLRFLTTKRPWREKKTAQAAQHPREKKWRFSNERSRIISSQRDLFNRMILSIEGAKRKLLPPVSTTHNSMSNRWLKKLLINICKVNEQPVSIKITNDHFCLYLRIEWKYISNICFLGTVILNET